MTICSTSYSTEDNQNDYVVQFNLTATSLKKALRDIVMPKFIANIATLPKTPLYLVANITTNSKTFNKRYVVKLINDELKKWRLATFYYLADLTAEQLGNGVSYTIYVNHMSTMNTKTYCHFCRAQLVTDSEKLSGFCSLCDDMLTENEKQQIISMTKRRIN